MGPGLAPHSAEERQQLLPAYVLGGRVEFGYTVGHGGGHAMHITRAELEVCPTTTSTTTRRASWVKTNDACRHTNGYFNAFKETKTTSHDACKEFCTKHSKCDAFDTDGDKCVLFRRQGGKTHTGNGAGAASCSIRGVPEGGSWIKTKGACRYSADSFNAFVSIANETNHDACREFCIENSKCDAFDTDGDKCVLFRRQGNTSNRAESCYVRDSAPPTSITTSSTTTTTSTTSTTTTTTATTTTTTTSSIAT